MKLIPFWADQVGRPEANDDPIWVDGAPFPQQIVNKKHDSRPIVDTRRVGPNPRIKQRELLIIDGATLTTNDMPSTMPMNPQTAARQQLRRYAGGNRHVLLTFLNENQPLIMAYRWTPLT
ncbi:hypothetical protein [Arthrobacter sp. HY1533]|uniref:hypothetical protein n=1 Tax=Arthrobacter sp. HY1533 TaxID=2970919 RepID=UPI0022B9F84F|nr:hypothetical protein [Arthrobacter sp. HY1533]